VVALSLKVFVSFVVFSNVQYRSVAHLCAVLRTVK